MSSIELVSSFCRDLNPEAVPLDQREHGFCIACGSKAERDPITNHYWHLEPRHCSDPNAAFVETDTYDTWREYAASFQEVQAALDRQKQALDELQQQVNEAHRRAIENADRYLWRARILLIVMGLAFLFSLVLGLLHALGV